MGQRRIFQNRAMPGIRAGGLPQPTHQLQQGVARNGPTGTAAVPPARGGYALRQWRNSTLAVVK